MDHSTHTNVFKIIVRVPYFNPSQSLRVGIPGCNKALETRRIMIFIGEFRLLPSRKTTFSLNRPHGDTTSPSFRLGGS